MTSSSSLGGTPTSIQRRVALLSVLDAQPDRVETSTLVALMLAAGHRDLLGSHGLYDKLHNDLRYLERQGLVDKVRVNRDGLPGAAARWACT